MPKDTVYLVNSAKAGNLHSFEQLVILYQDKIYSLAIRLTGTTHDAEDLAQEVFVKAFKYFASFRGDADFGTWLHRIAINTYLNTKRKPGNAKIVYLDEPNSTDEGSGKKEIADQRAGPEEVLLDRELDSSLQQALEALPREQKAAIMLREVEGRSYEEIASIMSCSIGTVRSRLSRARETLRHKLEQSRFVKNEINNSQDERRAADEVCKDTKIEIGLVGQSVAPKGRSRI